MPVSLSLAMIVKNEDQVLGRVLSQAKTFCDELVVVDTGSTDGTVALAESYGAKVYPFKWVDDFAAARNYVFSQCTGDWIIWLDADDVIPEASIQKLLDLKRTGLSDVVDAINCSYQIAFDAQGQCLVSMPRERLVRRLAGGEWQFPIHEAYVLPEQARFMNRLDIAIEHHKPDVYVARSSERNLNMLARLIENGDSSARNWYYYGKELRHHGRLAEAIDAFQRHLSLTEEGARENERFSRYQAMHQAMLCSMELKQLNEALAWGHRAIQEDSSRAEAYVELGVVYFRQQAFERAIPLLLAATGCTRPTSGLVLDENYTWRPYHYLSLCYEGLGDSKSAIEAALKAFPLIPDKQVIRDNIACFAQKL